MGCASGQLKPLHGAGKERVVSQVLVNYACQGMNKTSPVLERELFVASVMLCEASHFILSRPSRGT